MTPRMIPRKRSTEVRTYEEHKVYLAHLWRGEARAPRGPVSSARMKLAHSRAADAPIAGDLATAEAALTAATDRLAEARAKLADVDAVVADAQSRRTHLVELAADGTAPELARIREASRDIPDAADVRALVADALRGAEGRVLIAENALRAVLIDRCRAAHALAARVVAEAAERKEAATKVWTDASEGEREAARVLAMCVHHPLALQINPHLAPPPLDLSGASPRRGTGAERAWSRILAAMPCPPHLRQRHVAVWRLLRPRPARPCPP